MCMPPRKNKTVATAAAGGGGSGSAGSSAAKPDHKESAAAAVAVVVAPGPDPIPAPKHARFLKSDVLAAVQNMRRAFDPSDAVLGCGSAAGGVVGREQHTKTISSFIEGRIVSSTGGSMYVCGQPGSGKTLTVSHCLRQLQKSVIEQFQTTVIQINAMNERTGDKASELFPLLLKRLGGFTKNECSAAKAGDELEHVFLTHTDSGAKKMMYVRGMRFGFVSIFSLSFF